MVTVVVKAVVVVVKVVKVVKSDQSGQKWSKSKWLNVVTAVVQSGQSGRSDMIQEGLTCDEVTAVVPSLIRPLSKVIVHTRQLEPRCEAGATLLSTKTT